MSTHPKHKALVPLVGLETGSVRMAKQIMPSKGVPFPIDEWPSVFVRGLEVMNKNNWFPAATLIVGNPGEADVDVMATIDLICEVAHGVRADPGDVRVDGGRAEVREVVQEHRRHRSNLRRPWRLKRLNHRPDVTILENWASALPCSPNGGFYHGVGQVIRPNHLVREQHSSRRIHRAQQAVAEIRFLPRLHRVDVRGPEDVNAGKTRCEQCLLGLTLVARVGNPTSSGRVCASTAQKSAGGGIEQSQWPGVDDRASVTIG